MKLLTVASTFPADDTDPVPAFVKDQLIALKAVQPELQISVLAPHDRRSGTVNLRRWPAYDEYRFHYFWPFAAEQLAGRGIMPALKANPLNYLLIPWLFVGEFFSLLGLTRKLRPDVIYAHWFTPQAIVASCVSHITGTPFVFTTHASDVDVLRKIPILGRLIVRSTTRRAHAFTAVSHRSMAKLQRFFSPEEWESIRRKGAIIPMGVTLPPSHGMQMSEPRDRTVILFLGRLVEKKGVEYLLQALAVAGAELGSSLAIIAGDGPLRGKLERQAHVLGLGTNVKFVGFVSGARKASLLQSADVFVVPSIITDSGDAEGLPVSLLEGLAHGKVCIATTESGADDIIVVDQNGYLVPQKDFRALSAALIRTTRLDHSTRCEIEDAARRTAEQFDWQQIARQHHELLVNPFRQ